MLDLQRIERKDFNMSELSERCPHGVRWEDRCSSCAATSQQAEGAQCSTCKSPRACDYHGECIHPLPAQPQGQGATVCTNCFGCPCPKHYQPAQQEAAGAQKVIQDALNTVLWLEHRLPKGYGDVPHVKRTIAALEAASLTSPAPQAAVPSERAAELRMLQAYPALAQFFGKHGIGSTTETSCFKCGKIGERAITHLELPDIYICKDCASPVVSDSEILRHPTIEECYAAGMGPRNAPGKPYSVGGLPNTPEERARFEAYMRGHCWEIGKYDEEVQGYSTVLVRQLYGVWRDRGALSRTAPVVAEWWKLVPIEPTSIMVAAGALNHSESEGQTLDEEKEEVRDIFVSMVNVAPPWSKE